MSCLRAWGLPMHPRPCPTFPTSRVSRVCRCPISLERSLRLVSLRECPPPRRRSFRSRSCSANTEAWGMRRCAQIAGVHSPSNCRPSPLGVVAMVFLLSWIRPRGVLRTWHALGIASLGRRWCARPLVRSSPMRAGHLSQCVPLLRAHNSSSKCPMWPSWATHAHKRSS